jgi:hypothetical protein
MRKKPLAHDAFVKKLNAQMRKHPDYQEGLQATKIDGSLIHLAPPDSVDPDDPQDMAEFRQDATLLRIVGVSLSIVKQRYYIVDEYVRTKMLPRTLLFRLSREGRRSRLLQSRLHTLHQALLAHRESHGSWPVDIADLIRDHHLTDPWDLREPLQVQYTPPEGADPQGVVAEYIRQNKRKFVLYADGRQETWTL